MLDHAPTVVRRAHCSRLDVANANLRVHDPAPVGSAQPADFLGAESFFVERDGIRAGAADQVWNQVFLPRGNR